MGFWSHHWKVCGSCWDPDNAKEHLCRNLTIPGWGRQFRSICDKICMDVFKAKIRIYPIRQPHGPCHKNKIFDQLARSPQIRGLHATTMVLVACTCTTLGGERLTRLAQCRYFVQATEGTATAFGAKLS